MQCFIIITVFCVLAIRGEDSESTLDEYNKECAIDSNLSETDIEELKEGIFEESEDVKNHLLCLSKKIGLQDDEGIIDQETAKEKITKVETDEENRDVILDKCLTDEETPEDTAYTLITCICDHNREIVELV